MEERHVSKIVVDLLLERKNENTGKKEILMMLASYLGNMYDLPGGHLESNEDLFDAMIREAKEELGIEIEKEDMQIIHIYHHYEKDLLKFVFKVKKFKNKIQNLEPEKCKELKWIEIENLPDNTLSGIRRELEYIKEKKSYSCD